MSITLRLLARGALVLLALDPQGLMADNQDAAYEVDRVRGKLVQELPEGERRLQNGENLSGGDTLRTGWFSQAELSAQALGTRFHLGSRTRVVLAAESPGVIMNVERGRVRLLFDRLLGDEGSERLVRTPSALLAVRGTEYGVSVNRKGSTVLVVFSGAVHVIRPEQGVAPVLVEAGHSLRVVPGHGLGVPTPHGLSPMGWDQGDMPRTHGTMTPGHDGMGEGAQEMSPGPAHRSGGAGHHGG